MTHPFDSLMFHTVLTPLVAAMRIFALYVLVHGHDSPGGGFQAGVLFGVSVLLPHLLKGVTPGYQGALIEKTLSVAALGVLIYAAVGAVSLFFGSTMLDYASLPVGLVAPATCRFLGILGIEVGVAIAVAAVIVAIFHVLTADEHVA